MRNDAAVVRDRGLRAPKPAKLVGVRCEEMAAEGTVLVVVTRATLIVAELAPLEILHPVSRVIRARPPRPEA